MRPSDQGARKERDNVLLLLAMCYCASPLAAVVEVEAGVAGMLAAGAAIEVAVAGRAAVDRDVACLERGLKDLQDLGILPDQTSSQMDSHLAAEQGRGYDSRGSRQ